MIKKEDREIVDERYSGLPPRESKIEQQTLVTELSPEGQLKLEVIQSLLEPCDRVTYGQRLRDAALKLDIAESLSHFLGRFRQRNYLSSSALGHLAGVGAVIARWERFHLNPFPSDAELTAIAEIVEVTTDRLRQMLAPEGVKMKCEPIRLCAACYREKPYHRLEWQYQSTGGCDRHQLRLLSKCRNCQVKFPIPALWKNGCCSRCLLSFGDMVEWQKSY